MSIERVDAVRRYFFTNVEFGPGWTLIEVPAAEWDRNADRLHAPFGYLPPELVGEGDDAHWTMRYCPELIGSQTLDLPDEDFGDYVNMLEIHLNAHVTHWGQIQGEELEQLIDSSTYNLAPTSMALVNQVQLAALDPDRR